MATLLNYILPWFIFFIVTFTAVHDSSVICSVDRACLKCRDSPASTLLDSGLNMCTITKGSNLSLIPFQKLKLNWLGSYPKVTTPFILCLNLFISLNTGFNSSPFTGDPLLFKFFYIKYFSCSVLSFSSQFLIRVTTNIGMSESILGCFEIYYTKGINLNLHSLASGGLFQQWHSPAMFLKKISPQLSLGHILIFFSSKTSSSGQPHSSNQTQHHCHPCFYQYGP